ncbi:MAG: gliding motility-associated C-terminal domain-containing protein [Bacteroidota bacterium]
MNSASNKIRTVQFVLAIGCVLFLSIPTAQSQNSCDSLLTALYDFSSVNDLSGNGFNGTVGGMPITNGVLHIPKDIVSAFYIPAQTINAAIDLSFTFRVKIDQFHTENTINDFPPINHFYSGFFENNAFNLGYIKPSQEIFFTFNGVAERIPVIVDMEAGEWYCFAVVRNGTTMKVFIDGEQAGNDITVPASPINVLPDGFVLGQDFDCIDGCFELNHSLAGSMDNFRIYRRALSFTEIQSFCQTSLIQKEICSGETYFGYFESGTYEDNFIDQNGCDSIRIVDLRVSELELSDISVTDAACQVNDGSVTVQAQNGIGEWQYRFNNGDYQTGNIFQNLYAGTYLVEVKDSIGCMVSEEVEIKEINDLQFSDLNVFLPKCSESDGSITLNLSGGKEPYFFSLDHINYQQENNFQQISAGELRLFGRDSAGCTLDSTIIIPQQQCPLYIPNSFSPNGDGPNDLFRIFPNPEFVGNISYLQIFDRWGGLVFEEKNIDPFTFESWWDGKKKNEILDPGNYVYLLEINYEGFPKELVAGEIHLIR